jgi:hypothetical protein
MVFIDIARDGVGSLGDVIMIMASAYCDLSYTCRCAFRLPLFQLEKLSRLGWMWKSAGRSIGWESAL